MAAVFCLYNGYMQSRHLLVEGPMTDVIGARFVLGAVLWLLGWCINLHSDHIL